ncbi:MAG TPA: DUF4279 domain-containing protein [Thermoanaerobaculia bacterium]|nr:DUF4279 domain-containing protein [Thermoanaerobaculia bacterium]
MPGCVLRASGASFDVDAFLKESPFEPDVVYRKGQRRRPASRGAQKASGFNVVISRSEEPDQQVKDAMKFLKAHRQELVRLMKAPGIDGALIDFHCPQQEFFARTAHLPNALLNSAAALGLDVDVSFYLVA